MCQEIEFEPPESGAFGLASTSDVVEQVRQAIQSANPDAEPMHPAIFTTLFEAPWRSSDYPLVAAWIEQHAEGYELLHKASGRGQYFCPFGELMAEPLASLLHVDIEAGHPFRSAARLLALRSMQRIGDNDLDGAWHDIAAILDLSETIPQHSSVEFLNRGALRVLCGELTQQLLSSDSLTEAVAVAVLKKWNQTRVPIACVDLIDLETRIALNSAVVILSGQRKLADDFITADGETLMESQNFLTYGRIDWSSVLKELNGWRDTMIAAARIESHRVRRMQLEKAEGALKFNLEVSRLAKCLVSTQARSREHAIWLSGLLFTDSIVFVLEDRYNCSAQLHSVAAALAVYRKRHGSYPESLEELVPDLIPEVPVDLFNQKPLAYQRTSDGFLLYSLGPNGIDDWGCIENPPIYKGYWCEGNDEQLREVLNEPHDPKSDLDPRDDTLYCSMPKDADDWAVRIPPLPVDRTPPPRFELDLRQ